MDTLPPPPAIIQPWTSEQSRHLLFRAGFGGKPQEIANLTQAGSSKAVETLLSGPTETFPVPSWLEELRTMPPPHKYLAQADEQTKRKFRQLMQQHSREVVASWIHQMMSSPTPADMLHQKMTFFWHSHFATSMQKVRSPVSIYDQIKFFQDHALGNYGDILHGIIHDTAMLKYLDNDQNRKGKPNENLARELMELFSLGQGHYSEKDIQEGARALTGMGIKRGHYSYQEKQHDADSKTIFGQTGNFNGDDFVNLILEKPECAIFMTRKLWTYFAGEIPNEKTIQQLASIFRDSKYDIKSLLRAMFQHPDFYSPDVMGSQIKSPIQLIVGTARTLNLTSTNPQFYGRMLMMMGQVPYLPPNVKGWPGGREWIDTTRLVTRYTFANIIAEGKVPAEIDPRMKGDTDSSQNHPSSVVASHGNMEEMTMSAMDSSDTKHSEGSEMLKKKDLKDKNRRMFSRNLKINFKASELLGHPQDAPTAIQRAADLLLPVPLTEIERQTILEGLQQQLAATSHDQALQWLIGKVMLLPSFQLN